MNRWLKKERAQIKAVKIAKEVERFYANHYVAPWQRDRVNQVRALHEAAQKKLRQAHDIGATRVSEEFAQMELDFLFASDNFKAKNPGMEWHPKGIKGIFYKAFWKNLVARAKKAGLDLEKPYGSENQTATE